MSEPRTPHVCPGPVRRREFLKFGALNLGALASGLSTNLAGLLAAEAASPRADRDFSVILLWAAGGPSHLDTFDLKPDAPSEYRGPFRPIATNVPGIEISEQLPNLAARADRFALVRSLFHNRNEHSGGTGRMLSGYASVAANPFQSEFPEIGSVVAKHLEPQASDLPLFVANGSFYGGGPAYLGPAYVPFISSGDPNSPTFSVGNLSLTPQGARQLQTRNDLLKEFDTLRREIDRSRTMEALDQFNRRALDMLTSSRTRDAFDLSREDPRLRDRYGRTTGGQGLLLARRLVEAGVRFVQLSAHFPITKETGVLGPTNWDDHSVNSHIFKAYEQRMPALDMAVSALIDDLAVRGLDQNVLFIFCGEFGRTPKIAYQDKSKRPGRDHWCRAMSAFLSGGGLKMGQVIGSTNSRGEDPVDRPLNSNCLLATIYRRFGIDTTKAYHDHSGRPIPILTDGQPIAELF
ncbi:DUF1501 domain-containing protein [Singulisphaera sp. Ch08]|uniref:DUF1501 domain-containing protein n=1 Tax=Singulisphaera sp. Ch08 TaxID=3120278 RepID=A0AAU7CF22_9BACT